MLFFKDYFVRVIIDLVKGKLKLVCKKMVYLGSDRLVYFSLYILV